MTDPDAGQTGAGFSQPPWRPRPAPWVAHYDAGVPSHITPPFTDMLAVFHSALQRAPDRPAVRYFDGAISFAELDRLSDALAGLLVRDGFGPGDRLALYLQNVPAFLIGLIGAWKVGGVAVAISPMNKSRELGLLLADCTPRAMIYHASMHGEVVAAAGPRPPILLTTSRLDFQTRDDPRLFADAQRVVSPARDFMGALLQPGVAAPPAYHPDQAAMLIYTSGTTGVPKGAILTHGALARQAEVYRVWFGLREGAPVLGLAPLFHVTGLVGGLAAALMTAAPLVLSYRFHPAVMLDAIEEHRPEFTIGAITAFSAMLHLPGARAEQMESLQVMASGGAPISPALAEAIKAKFGKAIRNAYGLTETASPTHLAPGHRATPVDAASGALSIGLPVPDAVCWIATEDGARAAPGVVGEIVVSGPMVSPGYWGKPEVTAEFMRPDGFRTGDVGFMDEAGWFYLVDRKKDMINAGGYKVWPREIEDVLYTHPAIREAAVVGVPDAYRGETVKAVVSLKAGQALEPAALVAWCKARMAAYKYPRLVEVVDELPKTPTGKILRRALR